MTEHRTPYTTADCIRVIEPDITERDAIWIALVNMLINENERLHHDLMVATTTIALQNERTKEALQ